MLYINVLSFIFRDSPIKGFTKIACQKHIEKFCLEKGGFAALYGETELTMEQFYQMFEDGMRHYDGLRKKYNCDKAFPHVYDKISKVGRQ